MSSLGRTLLFVGAAIFVAGLLLVVGERVGLGKLPGDFVLRRKNFTLQFPLATSVVLSVVLTLLLNLWLRRK